MPLSGSSGGCSMGLVSDKPQPGFGAASERRQRLKREDHTHVKHDECFSDWKILVGPSDWKEHASGKIPDRFRIGNLPNNYVGSGLYELGVTPPAWLPPLRSNDFGFLKPQDVVVVYLGCAENVHQHLLRYGQTGAHLEGVRSTRLFAARNDPASRSVGDLLNVSQSRSFTSENRNMSIERAPGSDAGYMSTGSRPPSNASMDNTDSEGQPTSEHHKKTNSYDQGPGSWSPRGPRLFSEVFTLGCSIAFRWAATDSKAEAEGAEADLTEVFDYAWKRGGNFRQRSPDILTKIVMGGALGSNDSSYSCFGDRSSFMLFFFPKSRVGVDIVARKPLIHEGSRASSRSDGSRVGDFFTLFKPSTSQLGGKIPKSSEFTKFDIPLDRCGAPLETGLPCNALPVKGGKHCLLHKDSKKQTQGKPGRVAHTNQSSPAHHSSGAASTGTRPLQQGAESPILPGPEPSSTYCFPFQNAPPAPSARSSPEPKRRGSLSFNSWLRTSELRIAKSREWAENPTGFGSRPEGPKRSSTYNSFLATCEESQYESPCRSPSRREICGLRLDDGTVCPDPPRPDRKRCEAHKGLRNQAPKSPNPSRSPNNNPSKQGLF